MDQQNTIQQPLVPEVQKPSTPVSKEQMYKPSELIAIFNGILSQQNVHAKMVYLRGVYWKNGRQDATWRYCFDILRDEDSQEEITLRITPSKRDELKDGALVTVGGVLTRQVTNKGYIQLYLNVTRIEVVQEHVVDETEVKKAELRQRKANAGFRNVDGTLEQKLFAGERPKVALLFATTSITMADFNAGIKAAQSAIDFQEYRVSFADAGELSKTLAQIDAMNHDVMAIIRGGGSGIEHLDDLNVLEAVISLKTPLIVAVGHVEEKLFIKQLADKVSPTPNGLGAYFSDVVEKVSEQKNKSRAVLAEQIKKQFQEQIETANKQNKSLQEQLNKLNKTSEETQKQHKEQIDAANKQNKTLQEQLDKLNKTNEEAQKQHKVQIEEANKQNKDLQTKLEQLNKTLGESQKSHTEQMTALQKQMKEQSDAADKARQQMQAQDAEKTKQFNTSLAQMQETNKMLQGSLDKAVAQGNEAMKHTKELEMKLAEALNKPSQTYVPGSIKLLIVILAILVTILFFVLLTK